MSEKVMLPKDVCDALDSITSYAEDSKIVHLVYTGANDTWDTQRLSKVNPNLILQALVLGYEPIKTNEDKIKDLYFLFSDKNNDFDVAYRMAIVDLLKIFNVKYDWLEDDAE